MSPAAAAEAAPDELPPLRQDRRGPVATFTLDSPHNRNALSSRVLGDLFAGLQEVQADPDVRVVVLTGAGSVFCSGLDLDERLHPPPAPAEHPPTLPEVLSSIAALPQPVVARVNGHVRAGGMGLVAACDMAVAPESATFAFTEVRVGVAPAIIAVPAVALMGRRAFLRYGLTGDVFGAAEAARTGLLTATVEAVTDLDGWVDGVVASLLRSAPPAVAATKGLPALVEGREWDDAMASAESLSAELFAAPPGHEGMAAFLEKRAPSWAVEWPHSD